MVNKLKAYLTGKNLYGIFLHIIVVILAVDVVILARQNKELKQGPTRPSSIRSLQVGDSLCPFCKRSLPAWNTIDSIAAGRHVLVRGVCVDSLQDCAQYSMDQRLRFAVLAPMSVDEFKKRNHITAVPGTVMVSDSGKVKKVWWGVMDEEKLNEVKKSLPHHQSSS
jgi:hypothetical protein